MKLHTIQSVTERRQVSEKITKTALSNTGTYSLDAAIASTRNCENMVGVTQVPLGIAGPLLIQNKEYYIPLATTEGALVASVNRGCKAIHDSGGAQTQCQKIGSTRGPVFQVQNMQEGTTLSQFIVTHRDDLYEIAKKTSHHLRVTDIHTSAVGTYRFVRFVFDTQDAMGLNMVTIATQEMVSYIEKQTGIPCVSLSGNFCVDKKPSWLNFIDGRGIKAWAEVVIPQMVLRKILKTTAQQIYDVWLSKCIMGSIMSGSMGYNAQYSNVVAALFLATGQDIAHVVEGSLGVTTTEVRGKSLYISVYLPDLMVGTVGGGTALATQKEALLMLGVFGGDGGNNSELFSRIISCAVLAGELSLLASLSEKTLAKAHINLARGGRQL